MKLVIDEEKELYQAAHAGAPGSLGYAYLALGDAHRAIEHYDLALAVFREIGDRGDEGEALWGKSQALDRLGDRPQAIAQAQAALEIWEQIKDPRIDEVNKQLREWQMADS